MSSLRSQKPTGTILKHSIANIGELDKAHIPVWVLILRFDPVTIHKHAIATNKITNGRSSPSSWNRHCTSTSLSSFNNGWSSLPKTCLARPSPPRCTKGSYSKSSLSMVRLAAM